MEFHDMSGANGGPSTSGVGRQTMRQLFRVNDREEEIVSYPTSSFETPNEAEYRYRSSFGNGESKSFVIPKLIIFGTIFLAILGGIVGLLVYVAGDSEPEEEHGSIIPSPEPYQECTNRTLNVRDVILIECVFRTNHKYWSQLSATERATVQTPDKVMHNLTGENSPATTTWRWTLTNTMPMTCPWSGQWAITFYDSSNNQYNSSFYIRIFAPQLQVEYINSNNVRCNYAGGCEDYIIEFIDTTTNFTLHNNKVCNGQTSYFEGTNLTCNVTVLDEANGVMCELHNSLGERVGQKQIGNNLFDDTESDDQERA